jgi:hypothetical protein
MQVRETLPLLALRPGSVPTWAKPPVPDHEVSVTPINGSRDCLLRNLRTGIVESEVNQIREQIAAPPGVPECSAFQHPCQLGANRLAI